MPIDFQCIRCWEQIQVPDGAQETSATCPHCQHRQRVPGYFGTSANHSASEQEENFADDDAADDHATEFVPPITERDYHELARRRLRIPVKACQWLLLVAWLTLGMLGLFTLGLMWERGIGNADFDGLMISAFLLSFPIGISILAMNGLRHAGKADHRKMAWGGFVMATMIGVVYPLLLPFTLWGMVVMANRDVDRGFKR